jgi:hypothetical protein
MQEISLFDTALQTVRLSTIKTLDTFDFSFQPSLDRNRILALAQLGFIERHAGLYRAMRSIKW